MVNGRQHFSERLTSSKVCLCTNGNIKFAHKKVIINNCQQIQLHFTYFSCFYLLIPHPALVSICSRRCYSVFTYLMSFFKSCLVVLSLQAYDYGGCAVPFSVQTNLTGHHTDEM